MAWTALQAPMHTHTAEAAAGERYDEHTSRRLLAAMGCQDEQTTTQFEVTWSRVDATATSSSGESPRFSLFVC